MYAAAGPPARHGPRHRPLRRLLLLSVMLALLVGAYAPAALAVDGDCADAGGDASAGPAGGEETAAISDGVVCAAAEQPTDEPTEDPTEEATEESTEEAIEAATEEATEESTDEPTEEATEQATEEATEEPTEEATGGDYPDGPYQPEPGPVTVTVTKVSSADESVTLSGATFELYVDDGDTSGELDDADTLLDTCTTDTAGQCVFADLDPNTTYFLRETEAPEGYSVVDDGVRRVVVRRHDVAVTVRNVPDEQPPGPEPVTVTLRKVSSDDPSVTLAGAIFELYADDGDTPGELDAADTLVVTCTTAADGTCVFEDLTPNATYFLVETQAPDGFDVVGDPVTEVALGEEDEEVVVENAPEPEVRPREEERPPRPAPEPELPVTGLPTGALVALAFVLSGAGLTLLRSGRAPTPDGER